MTRCFRASYSDVEKWYDMTRSPKLDRFSYDNFDMTRKLDLPIALAVLTNEALSEISAWNLDTKTNTIQHKKNKLANTDKIQGNLYIQL